MKIGVMQGRLSSPVDNHIQEFPLDWRQEFDAVKAMGLFGIEWIVTQKCFEDNPVFISPKILEMYPVTSVCLDVLVDTRITNEKFVNYVFDTACRLGLSRLTVPLLDDSDLSDDEKRKIFCDIIKPIGEKFPHVNFSFEAELEMHKLKEIISLCDNFNVTYDTGNATSCRFNHDEYIKYFSDKINNVHIKDRTFDATTVAPLTGDTDFDTIFRALSTIDYRGAFVLQTARGDMGKEFQTIKKHKQLFEELHAKYF